MSPEMFCCCKKQPSWIFVYTDEQVFGICDTHFESIPHRLAVKHVINIDTRKISSPEEIFSDAQLVEAS